MGKWILVADHPENTFFRQFHNALIYRDARELSRCEYRTWPCRPLTSMLGVKTLWLQSHLALPDTLPQIAHPDSLTE